VLGREPGERPPDQLDGAALRVADEDLAHALRF